MLVILIIIIGVERAKNTSFALKSQLPIGLMKDNLFEKWLYANVLSDSTVRILLKPGCTSLNESCNKIINKYANKKRHLDPLSYAHAVARGVMQWNSPYKHLADELTYYGICVSDDHMHWINKQIQHTNYVSAKSTSHEAHLKKHQRKYESLEVDDTFYTGGSASIFDYIDQLEMDECDCEENDE